MWRYALYRVPVLVVNDVNICSVLCSNSVTYYAHKHWDKSQNKTQRGWFRIFLLHIDVEFQAENKMVSLLSATGRLVSGGAWPLGSPCILLTLNILNLKSCRMTLQWPAVSVKWFSKAFMFLGWGGFSLITWRVLTLLRILWGFN